MQHAILLTFLAGLSTIFGAVIVLFMKNVSLRAMALGMSFSAGVMIYISFVELMPSSFETMSQLHGETLGRFIALGSFIFGVLFAALIDFFIPSHLSTNEDEKSENKKYHHHIESAAGGDARFRKSGMVIAIAMTLHNFPEGLAVFVSSTENITFGISIAVAIALHNIPEGVAVALPVYASTKSKTKAFLWTGISGLAEPVGAIAGYFLLSKFIGESLIGFINPFVAGVMIYIALDELLPMAKEYGEEHYGIIGVFSGIILIAISMILIN